MSDTIYTDRLRRLTQEVREHIAAPSFNDARPLIAPA